MGEILNLIESVSGGFPSYFYIVYSNIFQLYIELTKCLLKFCSFKGGTVCDYRELLYLIFSEMRELNKV